MANLLPSGSGARSFRSDQKPLALPIMLLTAKADDALRIRLLREGAQDYLTKPFLVEELRARVGSLITGKLANEALQGSEDRFRLLFESVADGVLGVDLQGECMFINPAGLRLLGYEDATQLIGKPIHPLIHYLRPDGSPCLEEDCRVYRAFRENQNFYADNELFWRRDDSSLNVEYRSHPIRRDGQIVGSVVTFTDISERKRTEQQLRQAAIVFNSTNEGIIITDAATKITAVNRAFRRRLFVPRTPALPTHRCAQDRPLLHRRPAPQCRFRRNRRSDYRPRPRPETESGGRRRGDGRTALLPTNAGVRLRPGPPLRPSSANPCGEASRLTVH